MSIESEFTSRLPEIAAALPLLVDRGLAAGAELVVNSAKDRVPVGDPTPHLKDRINAKRAGRGKYIVYGGDGEAWWGHFVEHGTSHSAPEPFLVPALEEERDPILALVTEELRGL